MELVPSKLEIGLRQLGESDHWLVAELLNSGYGELLGQPGYFTDSRLKTWLTDFSACRVITMQKTVRTYTIGFAGLRQLNQKAKHAELVIFAVGASAGKGPVKSLEDSAVIDRAISWCFAELGLNRVWMSVLDSNSILDLLEGSGWLAEGVKLQNSFNFKGGRNDEVICSITAQSWESGAR